MDRQPFRKKKHKVNRVDNKWNFSRVYLKNDRFNKLQKYYFVNFFNKRPNKKIKHKVRLHNIDFSIAADKYSIFEKITKSLATLKNAWVGGGPFYGII